MPVWMCGLTSVPAAIMCTASQNQDPGSVKIRIVTKRTRSSDKVSGTSSTREGMTLLFSGSRSRYCSDDALMTTHATV